jgi:hypothetical protein
MKPVPSALQTIMLNDESLPFAECYTFSTANGQTFYFTNLDVPVQIGTTYFYANSVRVEGLKFTLSIGFQADQQQITCYANPTDTVNGSPFMQALRLGVFDGGYLMRQRAFFDPAAWPPAPGVAPTALGSVTLFYGRISTIENIGRTQATVTVKSLPVLLDQGMPRNSYQQSCTNTLFDGTCGLLQSSFQTSGVMLAGTSGTGLVWGGASTAYIQGTLLVTSGADIYDQLTIGGVVSSTVMWLNRPFRFQPAAGDTFNITFGCDHTLSTCTSKFLNQKNFRGFPFVPPAETAY